MWSVCYQFSNIWMHTVRDRDSHRDNQTALCMNLWLLTMLNIVYKIPHIVSNSQQQHLCIWILWKYTSHDAQSHKIGWFLLPLSYFFLNFCFVIWSLSLIFVATFILLLCALFITLDIFTVHHNFSVAKDFSDSIRTVG